MQKQFGEGNHVCFLYAISVLTPGGQTIDFDVADSIEFRDGKISSEKVYFFNPVQFAKVMGFLDGYMMQYS